ncbi:hypothetical protein KIT90_20540 [Vibrio sp. B172a]|uniref:hypothetical protein n=1 Tax=Vibrio sp. B172a TaxID=2835790 RepID=UPI00255306D8|nr:hypothetical protein [Vibrio sp. B172a]MDK9783771.1 hypothetical protein [Vibrio sp. B172a]
MLTLNKTSTLILLLASVLASKTHANPLKKLCRYTLLSKSEVPVLSESCPLGQGLWQNSSPKNSKSYFWIQCGVYQTPVTVRHTSTLLQKLNKAVWSKKSPFGYHCLLGPYTDYLSALKGQQQARKFEAFRDSTLREVDLSNIDFPNSTPTHDWRQFKMPGYRVMVPFSSFQIEGQYKENGKQWNRMNYAEALRTCMDQDLSLPDTSFWQEAESIDLFNIHKLPTSVPYWGKNKQAYLSSGRETSSTERSLLNALCVSPLQNHEGKK